MMYKSSFVASLKVGGKILRENQGVVSLPFGSEYDILLKNLNNRRAMVKVAVDGQDATEGTRLILPANGSLTLERFIKNGNLKAGNKFRFIERTSQIEEHRGIKEDDGLVRVEFWAEKEVIDAPVVRKHYYDQYHPVRRYCWDSPWYDPYYPTYPIIWCNSSLSGGQSNSISGASGGIQSSCNNVQSAQGGNLGQAQNSPGSGILRSMSASTQGFDMSEASANDAGITVAGSRSDQEFQSSYGFATESNSHVIVLQLKGVNVNNQPVAVPVTVDQKLVCDTCGRSTKGFHQYCPNCGTNLHTI